MKDYQFCVITKIPNPHDDDGNLAAAIVYGKGLTPQLQALLLIHGRTEVFSLGEILIVNSDGREIGGNGRKPSKWNVSAEYFLTVELAIERSNAILSV